MSTADQSDPGPIDVDVAALTPGEFARLLISRGLAAAEDDMALTEIHWDVATRYPQTGEAVLVLVGIVEQLLAWLAAGRGMTAAQLWQDMLLHEANQGPVRDA